MCGRYSLKRQTTEREYDEYFRRIMAAGLELKPRYNIAPSQKAPVIRVMDGKPVLDELRWGFRPGWVEKKGLAPINAKAETLFSNRMFRSAAMKQRCLVLATGWYEWQVIGGDRKQPMAFHLHGDVMFAMAGIWTRRTMPTTTTPTTATMGHDGNSKSDTYDDSYAIITTAANPVASPIHTRMPVVLTTETYRTWLEGDPDAGILEQVLQPYPRHDLEVYPVSTYVNSPKNIGAQCIEPFNA